MADLEPLEKVADEPDLECDERELCDLLLDRLLGLAAVLELLGFNREGAICCLVSVDCAGCLEFDLSLRVLDDLEPRE